MRPFEKKTLSAVFAGICFPQLKEKSAVLPHTYRPPAPACRPPVHSSAAASAQPAVFAPCQIA